MKYPLRIGLLILSLFALWLLMSGIYKPLIIGFGVFSSVLCVWIIHRLELLDEKSAFQDLALFSTLKYVFWLIVEIGKADWAVTKLIISQDPQVRQRLISVPATQHSDFAKTLFANSITLTPGTITTNVDADILIVHAIQSDGADDLEAGAMDARVSRFEKGL